MKKSKLFLLALAMPMLLGGLTSCNANNSFKHGKFVKSTELDYLYEVTYDKYSWSDVSNWMESDVKNNDGAGFGCSSIRSGNYYGRSFDFCLTDMCEFLVRTKNENGHFASIGVAIADCKVNEEKVEKINSGKGGETEKLNEKMIPFTMVDGINEYGVVCNTNVVPAKDLPPHKGESVYFTHGTNPGKTDLFYQFMPRYILDSATSAKHAVELLKQHNLTAINSKGEQRDYLGISKMGYELHCMIADKNDTYVVEMIDDYLNIIHSSEKMTPVIPAVMTNFYLTLDTPSGAGKERYELLLKQWEGANTESGMKAAIESVQYSPCYADDYVDPDTEENCAKWPTEFAGCEIVDEKGIPEKLTFYNAKQWCKDHWTDGTVNLKEQLYDVSFDIKEQMEGGQERPSEPSGTTPWISTHAEVYDIKEKILYLTTQEEYEWKEFKL